jgi:uncharacterized protein YegL
MLKELTDQLTQKLADQGTAITALEGAVQTLKNQAIEVPAAKTALEAAIVTTDANNARIVTIVESVPPPPPPAP